jgi:hypothetical protein
MYILAGVAAASAPSQIPVSHFDARAEYGADKFKWTISNPAYIPPSTRITWRWRKGTTTLFEGVQLPGMDGAEQVAPCSATPGQYRLEVLSDGGPVPDGFVIVSVPPGHAGRNTPASPAEILCWKALSAKYALMVKYRYRNEDNPLPEEGGEIPTPTGFSWMVSNKGFVAADDRVRIKWHKESDLLLEGTLFAHQFGVAEIFSSPVTAGKYHVELSVNDEVVPPSFSFTAVGNSLVPAPGQAPDDPYDYAAFEDKYDAAQQATEAWKWKEKQVFAYQLPEYESRNCARLDASMSALIEPLNRAEDEWVGFFDLDREQTQKELDRKKKKWDDLREAYGIQSDPAMLAAKEAEVARWEKAQGKAAGVALEDARRALANYQRLVSTMKATLDIEKADVDAAVSRLQLIDRRKALVEDDRKENQARYTREGARMCGGK